MSGREPPLDRLLEHWREGRHPSTSELIQHIGDRLRVEVARLPATKSEAAKRLVEAISTEPAFLLSARLKQLQDFARTSSPAMSWPVFEALSKLPADPRIATLATRMLVGDVAIHLTSKLTRRLLDCVEAHGDDAHFRALELGFPLHLQDDGVAARTARMLQRGRALSIDRPELPKAEREQLLAEKNWEVPETPAPVASLYAPVWEAPAELARRQVLADALLERGDPRGEFISLQLAGASPERQRALMKAHGHAWLGALDDVVDWKRAPPVFEQGFVSELSVLWVKPGQFNLVRDANEWATVRRVRAGLQRFSKTMRALEHAGPVTLEAVKAAAREKLPLPALRSLELVAGPDEAADAIERLVRVPEWIALHFAEWGPTRELRDALPRLADLQGVERFRFSAEELVVMPALLGQTGLGWLPRAVKRVELRHDEQLFVLERDRKSWSLDLVDLGDVPLREWKESLAELGWLEPTQVRVLTRKTLDDPDVEVLAHDARRFELPVVIIELTEVPRELAW